MTTPTGDVRLPATALRVGDFVDLKGDIYADPKHNKRLLRLRYFPVDAIERSADGVIFISFQKLAPMPFPADHPLKVMARSS